jgi:hypothetical protein
MVLVPDESHEPRFENRGMHGRRTQSTPACLGFPAIRRRTALNKHFEILPIADLRVQLVISRA